MKKTRKSSKLKLSKIFFLMGQEGRLGNEFKFYGFVPYKFGPYSFELFHDIEELEQKKMLSTDGNTVSYLKGEVRLAFGLTHALNYYLKEPFRLSDTELMDKVYSKYPEYTIFSESSKKRKYKRDGNGVYSIGYEGKSIDEFLMELIQEKVQVLVDVRNKPWSMKFGFKKHTLKSFCKGLEIEYINLPDLGISGSFRKKLETKKDYDALFKRYKRSISKKEDELKTLKDMADKKRIALMCFESNPEYCHRAIIAKKLAKMRAEVEIN
jgi:uncharacterized protein (DUF488 family)